MKRRILGSTVLLICLLAVVGAQTNSAPNNLEDARQLFAAIAGSWSCTGSFADGRALASDITLTPEADGRALRYHHRDRAPNSFVQDALWGPDAKNNALVSLAFAGNAQILAPQLFVAHTWSATHIVFEAQALTSPPFAPNRFTYKLEDPNTLRMIWEVERQGNWTVGDQLKCVQQH